MKKALMGTSAIALVGALATPATAAEFDVRVGGYMEQFVAVAFSDVDNVAGEDFDGIDSKQDAEIHFLPSITLDNGIKIGADVQLEAFEGGDQIDESFLFIRGSFGEVLLGSENSAGYKMTYAAPDVTFLNVNSGSTTAFVPWSGTAADLNTGDNIFRGTLGTTFLENATNNDAQRFTYFTPRFAGFQLGVSYARDGLQDTNAQVNLDGAALGNIFDVGANYLNSFGGIDVAVSGRWGIAEDDRPSVPGTDIGDDPQIWSAGLNLGFAGVTIGGSFAEQNNAGNMDGQAYDAGISYTTGPWGFSFTYFHGENVDNEVGAGVAVSGALVTISGDATSVTTPNTGQSGNDEEVDQYLVGISYKLAKGVSLNGFGAYIDFEEDTGDAGGAGDDVDGFIIGTGIKISF